MKNDFGFILQKVYILLYLHYSRHGDLLSEVKPKINLEYISLVPRPSEDEYKALETNIIENGGAYDPIKINKNDEILDGYTRFDICNKHNLPYKTMVIDLPTKLDEKIFVIETNLKRRHLNKFQVIELNLTLEPLLSEKGRQNLERQRDEKGQFAPVVPNDTTAVEPVDTLNTIAKKSKSGRGTVAKVKKIKEKAPQDVIDKLRSGEMSIEKAYDSVTVHVGQNTGEQEWYTPEPYILATKDVMGTIDVDPASTELANKIVKATKFYTKETDGLKQKWDGNVWMNPPYSQPDVTNFCNLFIEKFKSGEIKQGCVLVNNATETKFGQNLLKNCKAVCFIEGRIKFVDVDGKQTGMPLQGQMILYFGENDAVFGLNFSKFGVVLYT
jgi:hypothetical protein